MRPVNVPKEAIPIPPPGGPFPHEQAEQIHGIILEVDRENALALANFQQKCAAWSVENERNRGMKLALTAKPEQPSAQVVNVVADANQDGTPSNTAIEYVWISAGTGLGEPCPDLPALPVAPGPNHVHVARKITSQWFAAGADDTYPLGQPPVSATSDEGISGTFERYSSPVGNGWYLKVG